MVPNAVFLTAHPSGDRLDLPLIRYLCRDYGISQWSYFHASEDSECSIDEAMTYLSEYLETLAKPVHLIGHGTGGMLAAVYAQQRPDRVRSLTLLSVATNMAHSWIGLYYQHFWRRPCCRAAAMMQIAEALCDSGDREGTRRFAALLHRDLRLGFSVHSPMGLASYPAAQVTVPLLVCGSADDVVVPPHALRQWERLFKKGDRLHLVSRGRHFFHFQSPTEVGEVIQDFWRKLSVTDNAPPPSIVSMFF
ncbi:MAG: alpha/beta hydrolase [Oscillatoriales cyanobacterium SM2_2_1]|nr:alpha/beta hydrolase [Oscillatoriales cyanobacterium SM2_2_1]